MERDVHLRLVLPLSLLTFGWINRWCYALVEDGPDTFFLGFPLVYRCRGFHTSLSTQYFVSEMVVDQVVYYLMVAAMVWLMQKCWRPLTPSRGFGRVLWVIVVLYLSGWFYVSHELDDHYKPYRDFRIEVIDFGVKTFYQPNPNRTTYQGFRQGSSLKTNDKPVQQ